MFKVKYSFSHKLFYFVWMNIFAFGATILFIDLAFSDGDNNIQLWKKILFVFFALMMLGAGIFNLKQTIQQYPKELIVHVGGKLLFSAKGEKLLFLINDIKSYTTDVDGSVILNMRTMQ